ncbi:MAG: hypothetical protein EGQ84_00370 [Slackia sp.]|nr:hypothetical protein [Slackia sp.]
MRTRKPQVFATNLHKNALEHDGPRTQRWHFALTRATIRGPEATIRTTRVVVRACWQLLHPPSKIENRRLLIKKPAKRYEHSAGLRGEDAAESNRAESIQADSNSAAENATRGPHCSVFFPGWRKTRLWGLSKRLEAAGKARKRAAKREKRKESRQ